MQKRRCVNGPERSFIVRDLVLEYGRGGTVLRMILHCRRKTSHEIDDHLLIFVFIFSLLQVRHTIVDNMNIV